MGDAWCFYGVLVVIPAFVCWQQTLPVTKHHAIFFKRKWTTLAYALVSLLALRWQLANENCCVSSVEGLFFGANSDHSKADSQNTASEH